MIKVSVIIPVYNVENYLKECLNSILNQTLTDIEIICIDDESTDSSLDILREYALKDSRIKVLTQKNKGLAGTRNRGIKESNGKYIYFMDSDDVLELDALKELYNLCENKALDMVLFKLINFVDETKEKYSSSYYDMSFLKDIVGDKVFNHKDIGENIYDIAVSAPGKLFRRELIKNMEFPEGLIFEDNPFFIEAMFKSDKVYFYDKYLYNRRIREDSITKTNSIKFADTILISNMVIDITKEFGYYDEFKTKLISKKINLILIRFESVDDKYKEEFFKLIQNDFKTRKEEYKNGIDKSNLKINNIYYAGSFFNNYKDFLYFLDNYKKLIYDYSKLKIYKTARIDIKNNGNKDNCVKILDNSDDNSMVDYGDWFCDEKGKGVIVESSKQKLNLKIEMINDGVLCIHFRGLNRQAKNNERFPIYVDYTSILINDKEYLEDNLLICHDEPFVFKKDVVDGEILTLHVKWSQFDTKNSTYVNKPKLLQENLNKTQLKLRNKGVELRNTKVELRNTKVELRNTKVELRNTKFELSKTKFELKKTKKELNLIFNSNSWKITKPIRNISKKIKKL